MTASIVWFRLDLRIQDNSALQAAIQEGLPIVPVYIWSPEEDAPFQPGGASKWFLHHALEDLEAELNTIGLKLILRSGTSKEVLKQLITETKAAHIFWNRCYEPSSIKRDSQLKKSLAGSDLELKSFNSNLLYEPPLIKNKQGNPFQVYTPFWKHCSSLSFTDPVKVSTTEAKAPTKWPHSETLKSFDLLPKIHWDTHFKTFWTPTHAGAQTHLKHFVSEIAHSYHQTRNFPDQEGTSRLSPYLHFGMLGPRQIVAAVQSKVSQGTGSQTFIKEVVWREFAYHLLYYFPELPTKPLVSAFEQFPYKRNKAYITAWQKGLTGYPIVDAGMRQLYKLGWMHNRMRMVTASFLIKHLLQPWQVGNKWFWDTLVDADLANNTLGWQWVAGCGPDAAPYFRIFNPILQSEKFDSDGIYIKTFVPELAKLPVPYLHRPWEAPPAVLKQAGVELGKTYPHPIVDHTEARRKALEAYDHIKNLK